jgi:hypothetical protein
MTYRGQNCVPLPLTDGIADWDQVWPRETRLKHVLSVARGHVTVEHKLMKELLPLGIRWKNKKRSILKLANGKYDWSKYRRELRAELVR